jgi:hypothetical protein
MIESPYTEMHLADFARFTWVIAHRIQSVYSGLEDKGCWRRDVKDRRGGVLEIALACLGLILHLEIADLASSAQAVSPALGSIVACLGYQLVLRSTNSQNPIIFTNFGYAGRAWTRTLWTSAARHPSASK